MLSENTRLLVGSPTTVRAVIASWSDELGDTSSFYFAPAVQWGDITLDESLETIRLFAAEVRPAFIPIRDSAHTL